MRIAVLGTGALGSLLAAYLAPVADVTLLGTWREAIQTIQQSGLRVRWANGETQVRVCASVRVSDVPPVDLALVVVKGHQTARAAEWARAVLLPDGIALTLQNGLGNFEVLQEVVGPDRAALGVTMQGATLLGPGYVRHAGAGPTILAYTEATRRRLQEVARTFNRAGIETELTNDVRALQWSKLVVNSAINALTGILQVPNGWLAEQAETRALLGAAAQETAAVAAALGIQLPFADPVEHALRVARATATNKSSTLQDVLRGAPTELDQINGAIMREGKRLGVPTPVNEALLLILHAVQKAQAQAKDKEQATG